MNSPEEIKELLAKYGINHLHYMAPLENVPQILARGILCRNLRTKLNLPFKDISDPSVQDQRDRIKIIISPDTERPLHDYVPLYFALHTPTQYVLTQGSMKRGNEAAIKQEDLIFIEVDACKIFQIPEVLFTDGNAASNETRFYTKIDKLDNLNWKIIYTPDYYTPEYKRKKSAEVLVPERVPVDYFSRIVVYSDESAQRLASETRKLIAIFKKRKEDYSHFRKYLKRDVYSIDKRHYYPSSSYKGVMP